MSIESAKAFLERIKSDEAFGKKVGEVATKEQRMEYVRGEGYDFTPDELDGLTTQLSEDELNAVAGGVETEPCRGGMQAGDVIDPEPP